MKREINELRDQAVFKKSRHNDKFVFTINQKYYELPKTKIRTTGNIYHTIKPKKFGDVQNLYQDKSSTDMTPMEFIF